MAKSLASIISNKLPKLKTAMHELTLKSVLVGIPSDKTARDDDAPINNATIGYIMEHGAPEQNIPARPFLIPGIRESKERVAKQFKLAAQKSLKGDKDAAEQGLNRAGLIAQNAVRKVINAGIAPALTSGTLAARRRRGRTGTKPLIDTGQTRNSITFVVRGS